MAGLYKVVPHGAWMITQSLGKDMAPETSSSSWISNAVTWHNGGGIDDWWLIRFTSSIFRGVLSEFLVSSANKFSLSELLSHSHLDISLQSQPCTPSICSLSDLKKEHPPPKSNLVWTINSFKLLLYSWTKISIIWDLNWIKFFNKYLFRTSESR